MADSDNDNEETQSQKMDAPPGMTSVEDDAVGGEMNATMMSIDLKSLNLDAATSTNIKIEQPTDQEILEEQLKQKQSPLTRLLNTLKELVKGVPKGGGVALPKVLKPFVGVWLADSHLSLLGKIWFYTARLILIILAAYLNEIVIEQVFVVIPKNHPAATFYTAAFVVEILLAVLCFAFHRAPAWVATLPLMLLAGIVGYTAFYFHTADPLMFLVNGEPIAKVLNQFYIFIFVYAGFVTLGFLLKGKISRVLWGVFYALCAAPFVYNFTRGFDLELCFFGVPGLEMIKPFYLQPIYIVMHGVTAVLFLAGLVWAMLPGDPTNKKRRGLALNLSFLMVAVAFMGVVLMQKNRVLHVLNFMLPQKLDVGGVEIEIKNQVFAIKTKNYDKLGGSDEKMRYKMSLRAGDKDGVFLLMVTDEFDFPVKNLNAKDFVVTADGEAVDKIKLTEEHDINIKRGNYIIEVPIEAKKEIFSWDKKKKKYSTKEGLSFTLNDLEKIKRLVVKEGDETFIDLAPPATSTVTLPLHYFAVGEHEFNVTLFDDMQQELVNEKLKINIEVKPDFGLLSPVDGDSVTTLLPVVVFAQGVNSSQISGVDYYIDGTVFQSVTEYNFYRQLDVAALVAGTHELRVVLKTAKGILERTVNFTKQDDAPAIEITSPNMGTFASRQMNVKHKLSNGTGAVLAGMKVFVNGQEFSDFTTDAESISLPIARWSQPEIFVALQATTSSGVKVSDWVQINKGIGQLGVTFDTKNLEFLNYKSVAVVVDASISMLDNWLGKEKFKSLKKVALDPSLDARLKFLKPSFIVFGAARPHYYSDCNDVTVLFESGDYNQPILKRKLNEIQPTGVSSLSKALSKAYLGEPDRIYVFTDSVDACAKDSSTLAASIAGEDSKTQIVIFGLGHVASKDREALTSLAESTKGRFFQPDSVETMLGAWLKELVLSYELYAQGELIRREPLGQSSFTLAPGEYKLKIPYGNDVKEVDFTIENGGKTDISVTGEAGKVIVNVAKGRL